MYRRFRPFSISSLREYFIILVNNSTLNHVHRKIPSRVNTSPSHNDFTESRHGFIQQTDNIIRFIFKQYDDKNSFPNVPTGGHQRKSGSIDIVVVIRQIVNILRDIGIKLGNISVRCRDSPCFVKFEIARYSHLT